MEKATVLPVPLEGIDTYFVASDWHSYHLNPACLSILSQHALLHKPEQRRLIINGDFLDFVFFMKKHEDYKKFIARPDGIETHFLPLYEEEVNWGNRCLDYLQKIFSEIVFVSGNHDKPRIDNFLGDCPHAYKHNFDLKRDLKLATRKIVFIEYNDWLDIGDLSITHGMFHGPSALKKHFMASGARNVIFGHIHHDNCESFMTRGKTKQVSSLPAMCDLNPDYIKNAETNWTNGYKVVNMKANSHFNHYTFTIWDDELVLPSGKILKMDLTAEVLDLCEDYRKSRTCSSEQ
jgi:predicted phosphodiesterase